MSGEMSPVGDAFMRLMMLREAIASVSLSHDDGCRCTTCRAAHGDEEAFAEIVFLLDERK